MSRSKVLASITLSLMLNACGSSGGGGTGGNGGGAGQGATGGTAGHSSGGAVGTGGTGTGTGGTTGTGGASTGTGGSATGTGGASTGTGGAGGATAGSGGTAGTGVAGAGGGTGGAGGAGATCGDGTGPSSGSTCNTLIATGNCVQEMQGVGQVPTASGGTIMAGTYDLMSMKVYGGDGGVTLSSQMAALMISSVTSVSFTLDMINESGTQVQQASGPVAISGTTLTFAPTCPVGSTQGGTVSYTANGVTLTIIETKSNGSSVVSVYNKH